MKEKILGALYEQDGFLSGQELCERLGVSRTAVWKAINQLKKEGYRIEAVQNKGYRLCETPGNITEVEVKSRLKTKWAGQNMTCLSEIDSTNNYVKKLAEDGAEHGTTVIADFQSGGKGRRGRTWVTPPKTAIALSTLIRPDLEPEKASMMTLLAGMAVVKAVRAVTGLECQIKWPNDAVIGGKKISGTLTEMSMEFGAINYIVIGTGINANITVFPDELKETATSILIEQGKETDRAALICEYLKALEEYLELFLQTGDMSLLLEEYHGMLVNRNRQVRVLEPGNEYNGIARGIDKEGQLLVEREDGTVEHVYAGEVSVRGIYSYT